MSLINIDAVEKLDVDQNDHFNELRTLKTLSTGLMQIYAMVKTREAKAAESAKGMRRVILGRDYDGSTDALDMVACLFHWFGVSVCNYARLVGFVRGLARNDFARADLRDSKKFKAIKSSVDRYVATVNELADVLVWRNKIGAHFAITDPYKDDNIATLDMSVMFPVSLSTDRYVVGEFALLRSNPSGSYPSEIPHWSITAVFESLMPRYWPNLSFTPPTGEDEKIHDQEKAEG